MYRVIFWIPLLIVLSAGDAAAGKAAPPAPATPELPDLTPFFTDNNGRAALAAFESGDFKTAAAHYDAILEENPSSPHPLPARYMAAVSHHYAGDLELAVKRFESLVDAWPLMGDYARYFAAEGNRRSGHAKRAIQLARSIAPESPNAPRASLTLIRSLIALDRLSEAEKSLRAHAQRHGDHATTRLLLGSILTQRGKRREAMDIYRSILATAPLTGAARKADERMKKLAKKLPKKKRRKALTATRKERLVRGRALFDAHRSQKAISELKRLLPQLKKGRAARCEALFLIARSYDKLRKRTPGHPFYAKAHRECKKSTLYPKMLYFAGLSHYREGKNASALRLFQQLERRHPKISLIDDALIWSAAIHEEESRPEERIRTLEHILDAHPEGDMRDQAAWLLVWDRWRLGDMASTVETCDRVLGLIPRDRHRYALGRTLYWRGRALTSLGRTEEAEASFQTVLRRYPLSFYSLLSHARLGELRDRQSADEILRMVVGADRSITPPIGMGLEPERLALPAFQRGIAFTRLGLTTPARWEFDAMKLGRTGAENWLLAWLYDAVEDPSHAHGIARRKQPEFRHHYPVGRHREKWEIAFPRPFLDLVKEHEAENTVPAEFALAIMREESGFNPRIESWANAVGLMQLLIPTAQGLARESEGRIQRETLQIPDRNIQLGMRFLGQLLSQFGHPALAAAGYNAGAGAVRKWMRARGELPLDEFVESIPYRQTRRYVKSVMSSYGSYAYLYRTPLLLPLEL
jgi:soluble lytic murein transglycosylase